MAQKVLSKIQSADPILNRIQDQLLAVLNPILKQLGSLPICASTSRPTPSADNYGQLIRVKDTGKPEQVQCCVTTSAGAYEWIIVAIASS